MPPACTFFKTVDKTNTHIYIIYRYTHRILTVNEEKFTC